MQEQIKAAVVRACRDLAAGTSRGEAHYRRMLAAIEQCGSLYQLLKWAESRECPAEFIQGVLMALGADLSR